MHELTLKYCCAWSIGESF